MPNTESCWFCGADNQRGYTICGFCNHHVDDGPTKPSTATTDPHSH